MVNKKKKKICRLEDFTIQADHRMKKNKKRKRRETQVQRPCQRTEEAVEHKGDSDANCNWCTRNDPESVGKTILNIAWCGWPEYWEEARKFEETCCHSDSIERPSSNTGGKNLQMSRNNNLKHIRKGYY